MPETTDILTTVIKQAVAAGVREALNVNEATNRRLLTVEEAAIYLGCSKREIFNMISSRAIPAVGTGRMTRLDIRDLDAYIAENKRLGR